MGFLGTFLGTDLGTHLGINLAPRSLPFSRASFTNASQRYIFHNAILTGPFAGGTLATRTIDGKKYALIEKAQTTHYNHTEDINSRFDSKFNVAVDSNSDTDPLGGSTADEMYENDTSNNLYCGNHSHNWTSGQTYVFTAFMKQGDRYQIDWHTPTNVAFGAYTGVQIDLNAGTCTGRPAGGATSQQIISMANDWYYIEWIDDAVATTSESERMSLCEPPSFGQSHTGVIGYGTIFWGLNIIANAYPMSYIQATSSPATKAKDELSYTEANLSTVPKIRTDGFKVWLYPNHSSSQIDGDKVIASFDDSTETITVYLDSSGRVNIDGSVTGSFLQTGAHTWSGRNTQQLGVEVQWDNGSNSVVTTTGFTTGNGAQTGTQVTVADGAMALGMNHTTTTNQFDGLVSELEPR